MAKRKLKPRPTYRQHSEASYQQAIQNALRVGDTFWDYLSDVRLEPVISFTGAPNTGEFVYNLGRQQGMKDLAAQLQDIAAGEIKALE